RNYRALPTSQGTGGEAELDALAGLSFASDHLADALELLRHALVGRDDFVESVGNLAVDAEIIAAHADREIAAAHRLQRVQQILSRVRFGGAVALAGRTECRCSGVEIAHGLPPANKRP